MKEDAKKLGENLKKIRTQKNIAQTDIVHFLKKPMSLKKIMRKITTDMIYSITSGLHRLNFKTQ
jgi:hypothetical protein